MRKSLPFLVLLLAACRPDVPNLDSPGRTIVCLGDSITAGVGSGPGEAYPELLAARLGTEVINAGVSGDTAEQGLARVDDVLAQEPWMVIVELGGNDILRQVPPERTEAALRQILDRLVSARVVPVLVAVDAPLGASYQGIYDRLADEYKAPLVEDAIGDILRDRSLKADMIHPNAEGQKVLAAAIADEIEPILKERRRR
ncbi:MAG: arylesterase [Thermoanaerobaculia bacterium]